MLYSKFYLKKDIKIPTLLSLFIIMLSIYAIGRLFMTTSIPSQAKKDEIKRFEFTNIYSNQATVIWITQKPQYWWLVYGTSPNNLNKIAFDVRDIGGNRNKYKNHFVILKNLEANKTYYLKLTDGKTLTSNSNGQPFMFKTTEKIVTINNINPSFGNVIDDTDKPLENVLVILSIENAYKFSALSRSNGEWLIPMNYIIDIKTNKQKSVQNNEKIKIQMYDELDKKSEIQINLSNLSPLKEKVVIGKNYDYLGKENVLGESLSIEKIDFIYPKSNGTITSSSPIIKGVGIANNDAKITIKGENFSNNYNLKIKKDGTWNISTPISLIPGKYTLILNTKDENKKDVQKIRYFYIAKSGEQVLGEATPSAVIITIEPTIDISPSPTLSIAPTQIPQNTPTPTIPVTGGTIAYFGIISALLILIGFSFIFVSSL